MAFSLGGVASASAACPNESARGGPSGFLPDCRAYEMVSPLDKNGFDVAEAYGFSRAAESGDAVLYNSIGAFGGTASGAPWNQYVARRTGDGWSTMATTPVTAASPGGTQVFPKFLNFSADLEHAVGTSPGPVLAPGATENANNLYLETTRTRSFQLLVAGTPGVVFGSPTFAAASAGFDRFLIEANAALTPDAPAGFRNLYLWSAGSLEFVGKLPNGEAAHGSVAGPGGAGEFMNPDTTTTLSADGKTAFFTDLEGHRLYVRRGIGSSTAATAWVSAPDRPVAGPDPNGQKPASFRQATPDGSHVLFTSSEALTEDATTGPLSEGTDLYLYDVLAGSLRDISVDQGDPNGAEVLGVVGMSSDADRVYFVARGALASGATAGNANLYLWEATPSGDSIKFVATNVEESSYTPAASAAAGRDSRVSSTGRFAFFNTFGPAYRFDADSDELDCVSCTALQPAGGRVFMMPLTQGISITLPGMYQPRSLLASGRVFFNTADQLVPRDTNGTYDVYEWENGQVRLLSSGHSDSPSWFLDASPSGDDVFFGTRAQLLPGDRDELVDIYDARVGGGFTEAIAPSCGEGGCSAGTVAPVAAVAGSSRVVSVGDRRAARRGGAKCRRAGKATRRRHGRCARKAPNKRKPHHRGVVRNGHGK
jgi:hypothetical protein